MIFACNAQWQRFRDALRDSCPPLLFLSTCAPTRAFGDALAKTAGVRHVVVTTATVAASVSMKFASAFYTRLVSGATVQDAFDAATMAVLDLHSDTRPGTFLLLPVGGDHGVSGAHWAWCCLPS